MLDNKLTVGVSDDDEVFGDVMCSGGFSNKHVPHV